MQDLNRNFYDNLAHRLRFIRKKRGLTLSALAGGSASTAKSWESGTRPRPDQWEEVARRLGLSVSLVILGQPKTRADYDFIAKHADEIGNPKPGELAEDPAEYHATGSIESKIRSHVEEQIKQADGEPSKLGWIYEQLRAHVQAPEHWMEGKALSPLHREVLEEVLTEERDQLIAERKASQSGPSIGKTHGDAGR